MQIVRKTEELRNWREPLQRSAKRVALVPTMGALHQGHLSLVQHAKRFADVVALSIFVNPLQFNSAKDLDQYPRLEAHDLKLAEAAGVHLVFMPALAEIYPGINSPGAVSVRAGDRALGLCGATRPGHFDGVVTVVSILFNLFNPEVAVFGEKDYQQCKVIEQLVRDLHFPIDLKFAPLVRDSDGLALSSRNTRLSVAERAQALAIPKSLFAAKQAVEAGEKSAACLQNLVRAGLGELKVDYVEVLDVDTLQPLESVVDQAQLVVAAFAGEVRLIDNLRLQVPQSRGR